MKGQRKRCTPEERVAILRGPPLEKDPISKFCDELGQQPMVLLRWVKAAMKAAGEAPVIEPTLSPVRRVMRETRSS